MFAALLNRQMILAGASALAFSTMISVSFAQDAGDQAIGEDVITIDDGIVLIDDDTLWIEDGIGFIDDETFVTDDEGYVADDEIYVTDDEGYAADDETYIGDDDGQIIGDDGNALDVDVVLYDGEIISFDDTDVTVSACGGCEFTALGGEVRGAVHNGSASNSTDFTVAPTSIDLCLTPFWQNAWICRIQANAAAQ